MQKRFYAPLLFSVALLFTNETLKAQCTNRYLDTIFTQIDSTLNVTYTDSAGASTPELLDVYQPHGDSACPRHLIIFAHGGAFFEGTKNDGDCEFLCKRFAQRGYVCASINYRLASSIILLYDSTQIFKYAWEATSDFKAAIRYFYKTAANGNQWNIDTNAIFIAGSSAGAIAADFAVTVDSINELWPPFQPVADSNGGINGNSGNAGYSTKVIAVGSLAGAVNSLTWLKPSCPPIVFCQGTADGTIPYDCGLALTQYTFGLYPTINFCGSGAMAPALESLGVKYSLRPFPGSGHVPWDTNTVIENQMDSAVAAFFYDVSCQSVTAPCAVSAINNAGGVPQINVYPNPAQNLLHVSAGDVILRRLELYNDLGQMVWSDNPEHAQADIKTTQYSPGIYFLKITPQTGTGNDYLVRKVCLE